MRSVSLLWFFACLALWAPASLAQTAETPFAVVESRVDLPIPDDDSQTGLIDSIFISGDEPLESLEVAFEIGHPAVEELIVALIHPDGDTIILHNQTGSDESPFSPVYETLNTPVQPLASLLNRSPLGEWQLRVNDLSAGQTGTLVGWGLRIQPASILELPPPEPQPLLAEMFIESSQFQTEETISGAQALELNNDGLDDLVLFFDEAGRIDIYFSEGDGFLPFPFQYSIENPRRVAAGDLNGDGLIDFVAASQSESAAVASLRVFLGSQSGGFTPGFQAQVSITNNLDALALVDVNEDERLDLIVGGIPKLFTGVGDGSFQLQGDLVDLGRRFLGHADLNDDGSDELFVLRSRGGTSANIDPYILFSSPDLAFIDRIQLDIDDPTLEMVLTAVPGSPNQVEFVGVSPLAQAEPTWYFTRVIASGPNSFIIDESRLPVDSLGRPLKAFDVNGDGLSEFLYPGANGVIAFQKTGDILGGRTQQVYTASGVRFALPGLFFRDGRAGLAVIDAENRVVLAASSLGPLPTATPFATPAPSPTPFLFPPVTTPTPTPAPTVTPGPTPSGPNPDINGDGLVNAADLLILIQHWGKRVNR